MKALIIKKKWLDLILDRQKFWEIRGANTRIRGKIALIESGSGFVVGTCTIVDCIKLTEDLFNQHFGDHQISEPYHHLRYQQPYAWVINPVSIQKYEKPRAYKHPKGAVIWVNLDESLGY
jgi:hypothetical protein